MRIPPSEPVAATPAPQRLTLPHLRWSICALLFFGSTLNYLDRQTVSVLKPLLESVLHWSESDYGWIVFSFQLAYAIMMMVAGGMMDWLGTRLGYALAMAWWSLAAMTHAFCRTVRSFEMARFFLGAGEAGNFPAAIKSVAEWFPKKERALATGIFNAGTNVGAWVAPLVVVWLARRWSWQAAFIFTGGLGFLWLIAWLAIYRLPAKHPWIRSEELLYIQEGGSKSPEASSKARWREILAYRQAWGFILAKFMTDPIWWFYVFWLPSYLSQARGFSLERIAYSSGIPFLVADVGSVAGGWLSGHWIKRGWSVNRARKLALLIFALLMPAGIAAVFAPNAVLALALISIAMAAHQAWSANIFTLASDLFQSEDVGSVVGLGGSGGAIGGMIIAPVAGYVLQWFHTYVPLFIIAGIMHPLAIAAVQWLIPQIEPVSGD